MFFVSTKINSSPKRSTPSHRPALECYAKRGSRDSVHTEEYDEETVWKVRKLLMEKLLENPELISQNSYINNFYNTYVASNIKLLDDLSIKMKGMNQTDVALTENIKNNLATIEQDLLTIADNCEQIQNNVTLTDNDREMLKLENEGLYLVMKNLTEYNRTAHTAILSGKTQKAETLRDKNGSVISNLVYEQNETSVNEIYLATVGKNNIQAVGSYASRLYDIAMQCPYSGGPAVYTARSLYYLIDDQVTYDDKMLCLNQGIAFRQKNNYRTVSKISVYPNPANNTVTLNYQLNSEKGEFRLYDMLGKLVRSYSLNGNHSIVEFHVEDLPNCILEFKVTDNETIIGQGKLIIIK